MSNAKELYKCCWRNEFPASFSIYSDYFGNARSRDELTTVLGVYQGLVKRDLLSAEELHKNMMRGTLQKLITKKYKKLGETGYYKNFVDMKLVLDNPLNQIGSEFFEG